MHHHHLSDPIFFELWKIDIFLFTILIIGGYLWWTGFQQRSTQDVVPLDKKIFFITGMVLFFLVKGTPVDYYGHHYLFSVHMFQMAIVYLVVPPLMLLGLTDAMIRPVLHRSWTKALFLFFTHPLVSIVLFNMLFSFYHLPIVFDTIMSNHTFHTLFHSVLWLGAFLMWWPVMNLLPAYKKLTSTGLRKIAYIFANSVLITPVCVLIVFATTPLYETYIGAPQLFRLLPTLDDQQLGGVIMKVVQELSYITAYTIIFFQWVKNEREKEKEDEHYLAYSRSGRIVDSSPVSAATKQQSDTITRNVLSDHKQ